MTSPARLNQKERDPIRINEAIRKLQESEVGAWKILAASAASVSHTGDTNETALATVTIPGGRMGANGFLRVTTLWTVNNDASTKTHRIRLGGIGGTIFHTSNLANLVSSHDLVIIANRNATNSQVGKPSSMNSYGTSTSAVITAAVDTSVDTTLVISGQLADGTDSIALQYYLVEMFFKR